MNKNTLLWLGVGGVAMWYAFGRKPGRAGQIAYLQSWVIRESGVSAADLQVFTTKLNSMNDEEVSTVYDYIHDYVAKGRQLVEGSALFTQLMLISSKYNIFT